MIHVTDGDGTVHYFARNRIVHVEVTPVKGSDGSLFDATFTVDGLDARITVVLSISEFEDLAAVL